MVHPQPKTAFFVANRGFALSNSRLNLIRHFISKGWRVVVCTAADPYTPILYEAGATVEEVPFHRGGLSPLSDVKVIVRMMRLYRQYRPTFVHHFNGKPIIFGGLASQFSNNSKIINTVTGLGHVFTQKSLLHCASACAYRFSLNRCEATIFQNPDDLSVFIGKGWTSKEKARLIVSSGVDTERFKPTAVSRREGTIRILMLARLLWQKGVREFVEAAEKVKNEYPSAVFALAGETDSIHPDSVNMSFIAEAEKRDVIQFIGYQKQPERTFNEYDIMALPSYYREGVPRVLLEAAACGLAVVTTDAPGCRETVVHGETGYLVPTRNSVALADSIISLIKDPEKRAAMGRAGRQRIKKEFGIQKITDKHLSLYKECGINI